MKQTMLSAAAFAALMLAAPAAQAFTFQGQAPGDSGVKAYVDPVDKAAPQAQDNGSRFDNRGAIPQQENSLYFGVGRNSEAGSFNQRYNANNLFDPFAREGR